ncbi:hypothetical protein KFK09_022260 [Dendrobium nobile]|uniref:Uncharacterized protein n=1 Tax=Dendrobium nobile TaxID=94219 RepID=A0A8T3AID7_DENNO|nr:hypothetical protein KFK09_022260 [Dendrobium nobile]
MLGCRAFPLVSVEIPDYLVLWLAVGMLGCSVMIGSLGGTCDPDCNKHYHQGSSSAPIQRMRDCRICMQPMPLSKFFSSSRLLALLLFQMLALLYQTKVNMKATLIKCQILLAKISSWNHWRAN